jgi:hypothetical protein
MRRPNLILAIVAASGLLATQAEAQSTARPLPAFRLSSPITSVAAGFNNKLMTASGPTTGGFIEASAPAADGNTVLTPIPADVLLMDESVTGEFSSLRLFAEARNDASFSDIVGGIDTQRAGFDATLGRTFSGNRAVALHLSNESSFYKLDSGSVLVPLSDKPFNDLFRTSAGLQIAIESDEHFSWLAGVEATISGDDLVGPLDSLTFGGLGGVRYSINEDVAFSFGLAGESRIVDDAWVIPFFGMDWNLSEDTTFRIQGSELRLEHQLTETLRANCGARYDVRQYLLNGSSPVPGGVFRDEEIRVTAGLDWLFSEDAMLGIEVGKVMWNEFTVLDQGGALVGTTEADPAPYIGFSLTFGL